MNTKDKRNLQNQIVDILLEDSAPDPVPPPTKTRVLPVDKQVPVFENQRDIPLPQEALDAPAPVLESHPMAAAAPTKPPPVVEPLRPKEPKIKGPSLEEIAERVKQSFQTPVMATTDLKLGHSEHLRMAQERILQLEETVEKLSRDNEQLLAAGETMKNRVDELMGRTETAERELKEKADIYREEKIVLESTIKSRGKEISALKLKIEELETRLSADIKRVRVRERELENRLEIAKMEGAAVLRSKDEMLLELKRRMDQMANEMENYRAKGKETNKKLDNSRERMRRTVKALRLALSLLEGEEAEAVPLKKAD